jgi:hypothetical protein
MKRALAIPLVMIIGSSVMIGCEPNRPEAAPTPTEAAPADHTAVHDTAQVRPPDTTNQH